MGTHIHKSIQLVACLSKAEKIEFRAFLDSGLYTTDPRLIKLFQIVSENIHLHVPWDFRKIFAHIEPNTVFSDQRMRDQLRRLTSLLHQYLAIKAMLRDQEVLDMMTLEALANRGSGEHFTKQYNTVQKRVQTPKRDSLSSLDFRYRTLRLKRTTEESSRHRIYSQALREEAEAADKVFVLTKLRQYCEILNRNYMYQQEDQPSLIDDILDLLARHPVLFDHHAIHLWHQALITLQNPDSKAALDSLLLSLRDHSSVLEKGECRSLYKYALNFCIRRINAGDSEYLPISFEIYQQMLSEGLLHNQGWLSHTDVKNIVSSGIRIGEVDWVATFIEEARHQVQSPWAENVYTYCKSYLLAETGRKRQAIRLLQELTFSDVYYAVSARILLLRTFFELGEFDTLLYQITAFENFLKRNRSISPRNKKLHLTFARQLRKITNLKESEEIYPRKDLKLKAEGIWKQASEKEMSNKSWLLLQIRPGASGHTRET